MNSMNCLSSRIKRIDFPLIFLKRTKKHSIVKPEYFTIRDPVEYSPEHRKSSQTYVNVLALLHRENVRWAEIKEWLKWKNIANIKNDQRFIAKRHKILGPDIATAQFIVAREGKIRFKGIPKWLDKYSLKKQEIPISYVPHVYIESVDASNTELCYEGLNNLIHLNHIKELYLRNCNHIDDHCLHRLYIMAHSLEKLDVSGCKSITEHGICALHSLKKLKSLVVNDTPNFVHRELTCILLQDIMPELEVEGVDFESPALYRRLKRYL